jgi:catechol 2,3-dioxygenase-like lactoylglutathione lyase family enzyme
VEYIQSAAQIAIEHMSDAVALFVEHLGFEEVMRKDGTMAAGEYSMSVLRAPGTNVDVQLTGMAPIAPQGRKHLSQFGFVSDDAEGDRAAMSEWCISRGLHVVEGEYGPGFLWIDLPDVLMDFVFEIMDRSALLGDGYRFPET